MGTKTDYAAKLLDEYNTVDQSDSGMMRSDETKARLKDLGERHKQATASGAGRGKQGGPTADEVKNYASGGVVRRQVAKSHGKAC